MKYKILFTEQAELDLRDIYQYIAYTLIEPKIALRQLNRIEKCILSLEEMPERFKLFEKEPWHSRGLRQMLVDNFIVFYIPSAEKKIVTVIRVLGSLMYIDKNL